MPQHRPSSLLFPWHPAVRAEVLRVLARALALHTTPPPTEPPEDPTAVRLTTWLHRAAALEFADQASYIPSAEQALDVCIAAREALGLDRRAAISTLSGPDAGRVLAKAVSLLSPKDH